MALYTFDSSDAERFAAFVGIQTRKHRGELIFMKCPYCGAYSKDKEKFSINLDTGQFHCFRASCGAKGNMITLSRHFNFSLTPEADAYYGQTRTYRLLPQETNILTKPEAIAYLEQRGICVEIASKYNITVQRDHPNVLVFPFFDENGRLTFIKYRKTDFNKDKDANKEWCEPDCKPILFGMNHCNRDIDTLIITEGQIDSLSLVEAGIENAVSVPTGANGFT